ncbi:MAG: APC family permease [Candidatus Acidiferrales bacterium]
MNLTAVTTIPAPTKGSMLRILGVTFGIAVAVGGSIGAGIMRTPSQIANRLPVVWLIMLAWTLGAVYSLLGAWSLAEVAAMIPSSGAYYTVARRAFGDYVGFVAGWADWLSNCCATALAGILVGEYGRDLLPGLSHPILTGAMTVAIIALIQWRGIRWGSQFQNIVSAITALVFFVLIAAAYLLPHPIPSTVAPLPAIPSGLPLVFACVLVLQPILYTYDGWYSAIYFGDEIRNPGREMPRSMLNGVLLISAIYLLTNAALFHVLGVAGVAKENLPVAALGAAIFGEIGNTVVRALMVIALIALANCTVLCSTRILYAMSRDGWGARGIARVNRGGTPSVSLFLSTAVAMAFLLTGSFEKVLAVTTYFYVAKYVMSYLAVFWLRKREPQTPRPYRAWGYPWTTGAAVAGSLAFLAGAVASDTRNSFYALLILLASYPVYRLARKKFLLAEPR